MCLGIALGWASIAAQATWVDRAVIAPARLATERWSSPAGQPGPGAPTLDYYVDFDGYYFVDYAREIARGHGLRIHWTRLDNTPDGRAVHWSSAFPWWLVGLGATTGVITGEGVDGGIRDAAYLANPLLFALAVAGAGFAVWRVLGGVPAGALVLTLSTHGRLLEDFGYAKPDHHGLLIVFALGLLLCCWLGGAGWASSERRELRSAQRWMIASGVFGGLGLWTAATQMSVVIAGVGIGAMVAMGPWRPGRDRHPAPADELHPELWRLWAWSGAVTSLVAYALEYGPAGAGMRLEVNHPLHALCWLAAGELLHRFASWRCGRFDPTPTSVGILTASVFGVLLLPAVVLFGPVRWFWPKDPYMLNLHSRIAEFAPLWSGSASITERLAMLGVPAFAAWIATAWTWVRRGQSERAARAWVLLAPYWILLAWTLAQGRWLGLSSAAGCAAVALLCAVAVDRLRNAGFQPAWAALLVGIALAGVANLALLATRLGEVRADPVVPSRIEQLPLATDILLRDLAANLCPPDRHRGPVRVMTGPSETARLHAFGRCRGVGSPFWENVGGVRASADFFAATDDLDPLEIAVQREIDYVLIANGAAFVEYMDLVRHGTTDPERAAKTFGSRLIHAQPPAWLKAVPLRGSPAGRHWRLYRVERGSRTS